MTAPALLAYRFATWALSPLSRAYLRGRVRAGKEDGARLGERFGRPTAARPAGRLVWLHGASVGEAGVLLTLRAALAAQQADLSFLFTTGTRTSAALLAQRLPAGSLHQFAPIDSAAAARRFLAHWRPDLGVFAESELWPNTILEAQRAGVRLALVNARLSPRSLARWAAMPEAARTLLSAFDVLLAADTRTAEGLSRLAGRAAPLVGNLKYAAPAPRVDLALLGSLQAAVGDRPVWLAASTREGEEEIVLAAHARLRESAPDALLLLALRHPERADGVLAHIPGAPRRSAGGFPGAGDSVFLIDTIGELGTFYALAPAALVAGSLLPQHKGHNPIEPAALGTAILAGPHVESFADIYADLATAKAYAPVTDAASIAGAVARLWRSEPERAQIAANARALVDAGAPALERTLAALTPLLPEVAGARA